MKNRDVVYVSSEIFVDKKQTHVAQKVRYTDRSRGFRVILVESGVRKFTDTVVLETSSALRLLIWSVATFGFSGVKWKP